MKRTYVVLVTLLFHAVVCVSTVEHSREYLEIGHKDAWNDLMQDWKSLSTARARSVRSTQGDKIVPTIEEIEKYVETFEPAFKSGEKYIQDIVKHTAVFTGRIKKAYSIQGKLEKKGSSLENLTDIIGFRLTCQTVNTSLQIRDMIKNDALHFDIMEEKCYGMCPGAEKYKKSGYRRVHLILNIKPENKSAELQIGTPYTNYWADWEHDFVYKGPPVLAKRTDVRNYTLSVADYFWKLDSDRNELPICPVVLYSANALDILRLNLPEKDAQKTYKKIGEPTNACFFWYDMKLALPEKECIKPQYHRKDDSSIAFSIQSSYADDDDVYGGHSREYQLIAQTRVWDVLYLDWQNTRVTSPGYAGNVPTLEDIKKYVKTFEPAFEAAKIHIGHIAKSGAVLSGRIKKAYSIQGKLEKYGIGLENLTDIIGFRLTCQDVNEALRIRNVIKKDTKHFNVVKESCYGMCNKEKYRPDGYRRIHLILNIKPENKVAELQIGTPYTDYWADWSHDFVYKGPPKFVNRTDVLKYSLSMADYFWSLDNQRAQLPVCPVAMQNASALTILKMTLPDKDALKMFKKLGSPPSACFWWFDMKLALPEKECNGTDPTNSDSKIVLNATLISMILFINVFWLSLVG